ncbi:MAG: DUF4349 domain-containing protein [Rubrobacteraceae bacterium]|nr:DUF4349 domain-containing protein [Rubrobacteraceae bacterium]
MTAIAAVLLALTACSKGGEGEQGTGGVAVKDRVESAAKPESGSGYAGDAVSGEVVPQDDFDRKIVKTADIGITSEDVRGGAVRAQQVASRFGGTIVSSQTYRAENAVYADLVVSVPSEEFENALDELRGLGEQVTTDTVSGQDVTEEYVDLQSRGRNLLAAEQTLLDLYGRAGDVQDALSIQRELTVVRGEIEQVQGRIQYLKQSSDTSQISLSIRPVSSPPKPPPAWDPALIVARAWSGSLAVLQGFAAVILSTLVFGWWIIPPLVAAAWWLRRRFRRSGFVPPAPESSQGEP